MSSSSCWTLRLLVQPDDGHGTSQVSSKRAGRQRPLAPQLVEDLQPAAVVGLDPPRVVALPLAQRLAARPQRHLGPEQRDVLARPDDSPGARAAPARSTRSTSSARSYADPSRLQSTRSALGAPSGAVGSVCSTVRWRTTSSTSSGRRQVEQLGLDADPAGIGPGQLVNHDATLGGPCRPTGTLASVETRERRTDASHRRSLGPRPGHARRGRHRAGRRGSRRPRWATTTAARHRPSSTALATADDARRVTPRGAPGRSGGPAGGPGRRRGRLAAAPPAQPPPGAAPDDLGGRHLRRAAPTSCGPRPGPARSAGFEATRARLMAAGQRVTVLRRRQVPADGRLRAADRASGSATPTGSGSAPTSRRARRSCTRVSSTTTPARSARRWSRAGSRRTWWWTTDSDVGGGASIMGTLSGGGTAGRLGRQALPDRRQLRPRHLAR